MTGMVAVIAFTFLSPLFHQEAPKNTIRILIERPLDENHVRIRPLLDEKKYTYQSHGEDFDLIPPDSNLPIFQFHLVKDENTRALIFLKGDADVLYDSLSIAKTEWLRKQRNTQQAIYSNAGESVSMLAMNSQSPILQNNDIKKAIIDALPVQLWVEKIFFNWVELVKPVTSEILTHNYIPPNTTLHYLTTSSREGQQLAFLTREALEKIGINVEIHIYEPSLFYAKIIICMPRTSVIMKS